MADDKSTDTSVDTEVVDTSAEDTSTNEELQETDDFPDDDTLGDDWDVDVDDEVEETDEADESGDEDDSATSEDSDSEEQSEADDSDETHEESQDEGQSEPADAQTERQREEAARRAYEQRELARKQAVAASQQEFVESAENPDQQALRQVQVELYNNKVEANMTALNSDVRRAVADIPMFKDGTPAIQDRLVRAVDMFEQMHVQKASNGDPIAITGSLYQYLQNEAAAIQREQQELQSGLMKKQETSKKNQKSRTLAPPARAPKKAKVDPMMEGFDEEAGL